MGLQRPVDSCKHSSRGIPDTPIAKSFFFRPPFRSQPYVRKRYAAPISVLEYRTSIGPTREPLPAKFPVRWPTTQEPTTSWSVTLNDATSLVTPINSALINAPQRSVRD